VIHYEEALYQVHAPLHAKYRKRGVFTDCSKIQHCMSKNAEIENVLIDAQNSLHLRTQFSAV